MDGERDAGRGASPTEDAAADERAAGKRSRVAARYPALAQALGARGDQPSIHDAATAAVEGKGGGTSLDAGVASRVGNHLGADFSDVRVHADPLSQQATQAMGARAFAYGADVFLAPGEQGTDLGLMAHELTHVAQQGAAGARSPQRAVTVGASDSPAEHEADRVAAEVTGGTARPGTLVVEDGPVAAGQMLKTTFMAALRSQVTAAADAELGPVYSAIGCPYIDQYFGRYATRSAADVEAVLRRYAPEARTATAATAMISAVVERVRAGVRHWRDTGAAPTDLPGAEDAGGVTAASPSALRAPDGRETLGSLEHELGPGQPLDGATASRLGGALGVALPDARVHTGPVAARKAAAADALAFTVGPNIVMGQAAPAPGSLAGDALLAHELTHVAQQAHAAADPAARAQPIGAEASAAEDRADEATLAAAGALEGKAQRGLAARAVEALTSGIQLQRCNPTAQPTQTASFRNYADGTVAANDPGRLTAAQIRATAEYTTLHATYGAPGFTAAHAELAIRLAIRDLQQGRAVDLTAQGQAYMARARAQSGGAAGAEGLVGELEWVQYNSGLAATDPMALDDNFSQWLLAAQAAPDPHTGKMNCWELVMFGAYRAGVVTEQRLRAIYQLAVENVRNHVFGSVGLTFEQECRSGTPITYRLGDATSPRPLRGDIVVFQNAPNHACIATGTMVTDATTGQQHAEVISLWTPSNRHVERTTIEALAQVSTGRPIMFWSARWS